MNEWRESLDGVGFPAVVHLLSALGKTGRLRVWLGSWSSDVYLREGRVVSARFGQETGLAALEAIIASLNRGDFSFADDLQGDELNVRVEQDYLDDILERMDQEWAESTFEITTPAMVPRPIEPLALSSLPPEVVLDREALETLMALDGRRTVADIAYARGVARSFRNLAKLTELGLVALEPPSSSAPPLIRPIRPNAVIKPPTVEPSTAHEADERLIVPVDPVCPRLGFADDPDNRFSRPTRLHRCFADTTPAAVSTDEQLRFCLTTGHTGCPRFAHAPGRDGAIVDEQPIQIRASGDSPVAIGRARRASLSLGAFVSEAARIVRGERSDQAASGPPSAKTPFGAAMLRRRRPTGDLASLIYFTNSFLDEPTVAEATTRMDLAALVSDVHRSLGVVHFELPVKRNRLADVPTRLAVADRASVLEVLTALIRRICDAIAGIIGEQEAETAYHAVYAAVFSDRPDYEGALDLRRRLPYPPKTIVV
jgi:hypothetical protein